MPNSIHVPIIAVGDFDEDYDGTFRIPGMTKTAMRLVSSWKSLTKDVLINSLEVGSIDFILSGDDELDDADYIPKRATLANIDLSISHWARRVKTGGLGVLHWVGHGDIQGLGGEKAIDYLYCSDVRQAPEDDEKPYHVAVNWLSSLHAINRLLGGKQIVCFIDACKVTRPERRDAVTVPAGVAWDEKVVENHLNAVSARNLETFRR